MLCIKMLSTEFPCVCSKETCFHCEDIWNFKFFEQSYSSSCFFCSGVIKPRVIVTKVIAKFAHDEWEDPCASPVWLNVVSVHKYVFLSRMTMKVDKEAYLSFFLKFSAKSFECKDCRMDNFWRSFESTIQITSTQSTSVVPINNSIRIQHWHYFEDEVVSKYVSFWRTSSQEI